jgi:2-haloacid dehalogenase
MTAHPEPGGHDRAQPVTPDGPRQPRVMVFDVNETLLRHVTDGAALHRRRGPYASSGDLVRLIAAGRVRPDCDRRQPRVRRAGRRGAAQQPQRRGRGRRRRRGAHHVWFATLPVHPDVVEGIRSLRSLGISLVTLSNGSTAVAQGLFDRNDIADCFDRLLSVDKAPLWKPAESAYSFALKACACEASQAMLVAVHPWDIHGAHQAGLATAWINRTDARYPRTSPPPTWKPPPWSTSQLS